MYESGTRRNLHMSNYAQDKDSYVYYERWMWVCTRMRIATLFSHILPFAHTCERILLVGLGRRKTESTLHFLRDELISKRHILDTFTGIQPAPWRINLDGGMVPLADNVSQINPVAYFQSPGMHIIHITQEESLHRQACNCFCLGNRTVTVYDLTSLHTL